MPYILSKMAGGVDYTTYAKGAGGKMISQGKVSVRGGADVADKKTLVTPEGVPTQVSEAELKALRLNPVFLAHEKKGALKVLTTLPRDPDKAAADMDKDKSGQITPSDYTNQGKDAPKTGAAE